MVYTERAETAAVSRGSSKVAVCGHCLVTLSRTFIELIDDRLYSAILRSRADSLRSDVILHE